MHPRRRAVPVLGAVALVVGVLVGTTGCTGAHDADPSSSGASHEATSAPAGGSGVGGRQSGDTTIGAGVDGAPIVFAFRCRAQGGSGTVTYTTYAAVWAADGRRCAAFRIAGTTPSAQQRSAVEATDGTSDLETLASTCTRQGSGVFDSALTEVAELRLARGILRYCPGHPEIRRLEAAVRASAAR